MTTGPTSIAFALERLSAHKRQVEQIRERAEQSFAEGVKGRTIVVATSSAVDELLISIYRETLDQLAPDERALLDEHAAVVAVGGTGRGELAPYSDIDLLFLYRKPAAELFARCSGQVVRDCWDAGLELGHSLRTPEETMALARRDPHVATSLVEARRLAGSRQLFKLLRRRVRGHIGGRRLRPFIDACLDSRNSERAKHGGSVTCLEPDVKRSLGGLRDLHLVRWLGSALFGRPDFAALRRRGALCEEDAERLLAAHEFLTRVRIDLHLAAGRANDFLSRDEQLRIARRLEIEGAAGQRPVERFMQSYFLHSTAIAEIARRFVAIHRPQTIASRLVRFLGTHRADGVLRIGGEFCDASLEGREQICRSFERILTLYLTCAQNTVTPAPPLAEEIRHVMSNGGGINGENEPSEEAAATFLSLLSHPGEVGPVLRSMYETGVLEHLVPALSHARCLLQFNQYHSYTVDEHSLRAVEEFDSLSREDSPAGVSSRHVHHRPILRLALLLHDLGKGFVEDHSDVGRRIAESTAERLFLNDDRREMLVFLVHRHLFMSHIGLRRDTSDPDVLLPFAHEVGSPELLRMLYVLTAADLRAVGPGVWTPWKAELLAGLFNRSMQILGGKPYRYMEEERLQAIRQHVLAALVAADGGDAEELAQWVDRQTDALSAHYLTTTDPDQIAADLKAIRRLRPGEVHVEGRNEEEIGTVDYRVIAAADLAEGCFHKLAGVLTAKRLEILTARICTTADGTVIDSFRVFDGDYSGQVPPERIDEVSAAITAALRQKTSVPTLFQRYLPFAAARRRPGVSNLPSRVVLDNDSSDYATIIDVFAHDRPGLLYTIARSLYELQLSVALARIATHSDQVVDVFYVTDAEGSKITSETRLKEIRGRLEATIVEFEGGGHRAFTA